MHGIPLSDSPPFAFIIWCLGSIHEILELNHCLEPLGLELGSSSFLAGDWRWKLKISNEWLFHPYPAAIWHSITCKADHTCVFFRLSANCLCDPAEGPEVLVCWTECRHWEDSGNSAVCHQSIWAVEIIRWKERHPESPSKDAKTKNPAQQIRGMYLLCDTLSYSWSWPCRNLLWQNKVHCYSYRYLNISGIITKWSAPLSSEPSIAHDSETFQINSYLSFYYPEIHFNVILDHFTHVLNNLIYHSVGIPYHALELSSCLCDGFTELWFIGCDCWITSLLVKILACIAVSRFGFHCSCDESLLAWEELNKPGWQSSVCIKILEVGHIPETVKKELKRHLNGLKQCHTMW